MFHLCLCVGKTTTEIADRLLEAIRERGYSCTVSDNVAFLNAVTGSISTDKNRCNIFVAPVFNGTDWNLPAGRQIVLNLEQLYHGSFICTEGYLQKLTAPNTELWDYNTSNITWLLEHYNKTSHLVQLGYCFRLTAPIHLHITPDVGMFDAVMIGNPKERRNHMIDGLRAYGINVLYIWNIWGWEKELLIKRTKILLNIHAWDGFLFEPRIMDYLNCGGFVITEDCRDIGDYSDLREGLVITPIGDFVAMAKAIKHYLSPEGELERKQIADRGYQSMRNRQTQVPIADAYVDMTDIRINQNPESNYRSDTLKHVHFIVKDNEYDLYISAIRQFACLLRRNGQVSGHQCQITVGNNLVISNCDVNLCFNIDLSNVTAKLPNANTTQVNLFELPYFPPYAFTIPHVIESLRQPAVDMLVFGESVAPALIQRLETDGLSIRQLDTSSNWAGAQLDAHIQSCRLVVFLGATKKSDLYQCLLNRRPISVIPDGSFDDPNSLELVLAELHSKLSSPQVLEPKLEDHLSVEDLIKFLTAT